MAACLLQSDRSGSRSSFSASVVVSVRALGFFRSGRGSIEVVVAAEEDVVAGSQPPAAGVTVRCLKWAAVSNCDWLGLQRAQAHLDMQDCDLLFEPRAW